ncbi:hypothetical protein Tco_0492827 [Tanacetum coccineum]
MIDDDERVSSLLRVVAAELVDTSEVLVSYTLMAFGGNTHELDSIWEETDEITTLYEFQYQKSIQLRETASRSIATASGGSNNDVRILVTSSEAANSKETLSRFVG